MSAVFESQRHMEEPWATPPEGRFSAMVRFRDLTAEAVRRLAHLTTRAVQWAPNHERAFRVLSRRSASAVTVTGLEGVGRTRFVEELAELAARGEVLFRQHRFVLFDVSNVPPEDSQVCLASVLAKSADEVGLVACLVGLTGLLRRNDGGSNKPLLRAYLSNPECKLIGILTNQEYNECIGSDADLVRLFARIEVAEPTEEDATNLLLAEALTLQNEYGLAISPTLVRRTVSLSSQFVLNEQLPAKARQILRTACDDVSFSLNVTSSRRLGGDDPSTDSHARRAEITESDVVRVIAERTGIPEETIAGAGNEIDFESALTIEVVGQDQAVQAVATELNLVKAGLTDPGKPASVMLFAGMTGVGKTELAKAVARLYSSSKRLQTYTMANFTEPHSVSGIIGVPPGYVGYEHGGRLINELNSDPYAVFLLDEADKAHPNVWKPFLNLFDEGWIVDQRGTKGWADRAIFILTTNAGDNAISQMSRQGKSQSEIVEHVKRTLSRLRHERSSQPVFPSQFLSRLSRIVVFQPLDEQAMIGIAQRQVARLKRAWQQRRGKSLEFEPQLIDLIGKLGHQRNEASGGQEGGRIIRRLMTDMIEGPLQSAASANPQAYAGAEIVTLKAEDIPSNEMLSDVPIPVKIQFRSATTPQS